MSCLKLRYKCRPLNLKGEHAPTRMPFFWALTNMAYSSTDASARSSAGGSLLHSYADKPTCSDCSGVWRVRGKHNLGSFKKAAWVEGRGANAGGTRAGQVVTREGDHEGGRSRGREIGRNGGHEIMRS